MLEEHYRFGCPPKAEVVSSLRELAQKLEDDKVFLRVYKKGLNTASEAWNTQFLEIEFFEKVTPTGVAEQHV